MNKKSVLAKMILALAVIAGLYGVLPAGATGIVYFVKCDANGANTGATWANAFTDLQSAIVAASSGDEIWVAAGTYKPTTGTDRSISFTLKNGVAIYGGFDGTETTLSQRDYATNVTILSGDIGTIGVNADNSYHVVIGSNTDSATTLDGFTITKGNADTASPLYYGGGLYSHLGNLTLSNLIFKENSAAFGGGMFSEGYAIWSVARPTLTNVTFLNNSASGEGGGMENRDYSQPTLTNVSFISNISNRSGGGMLNLGNCDSILRNVTFSNNTAVAGGGLSNLDSSSTLANVTFDNNTSSDWAGGMDNAGNGTTILTNVTFRGNSATGFGGAISNHVDNAELILINVTINGNSAGTYGDGVYNGGGILNIRNSILHGNGEEIYDDDINGTETVTYSIVQGGYAGLGNLDTDPLLGPLQNNGGSTRTMALALGSPAIDAADDSICPDLDQRGLVRPQGTHCDMGAYEYESVLGITHTPTIFPPTLTATSTPNIITISGNVGVDGVTLSYVDGGTWAVISDSNGNYSISIVASYWSGTVTPSKPGYRFSPASRSYSIVNSVSNMNYTAERVYTISGNAGISGATLSYTDGTAKTVVSDANGNYSLQVPENWTGTVTPSRSNYDFSPASRSYTNVQADQSAQNYLATPLYTISGNVGVVGAELDYVENGLSKKVTSGSDGSYSIIVKAGWSGTVTPYKAGVTFTPTNKSYIDVQANQSGSNYSAVITVTSISDGGSGSLRQAVTDSVLGTGIRFDPTLAGQKITLVSTISLNKNLTVDGSGLNPPIEISGGGVVRIFSVGSQSVVTLRSLTLADGKASGTNSGGAIYTSGLTTINIDDVSFTRNSAYDGGAIYSALYNTHINITHSEFFSNSAQRGGGAIYLENGDFLLQSSVFDGNSAASTGGAVLLTRSGARILEDNTFSNNNAVSGGAIHLLSLESSNILRKNLFSNNTASLNGGAIFESLPYTLASTSIENNTFYSNQADLGGAVFTSRMTIRNNTFSNNRATQAGGNAGGSLFLWAPMDIKLYNNILANSTAGGECYQDGSGAVSKVGTGNLIEDGSSACLPTLTGDPLLGPLTDNGGPTWTMALLPGSPAIDAGDDANCPATDQRGMTRPQGAHCDIGAYEADDTIIPTPTFTPTITLTPTNTPPPTFTATPTPTSVVPTQRPVMKSQVLTPLSLTTDFGTTSGSLPSLGLIQQSGAEDNPDTYISFQAPNTGYLGYQSFYLPSTVRSNLISTMLLQVNFKGSASSTTQTWTWSIYDGLTGMWIKLGDSIGTTDGQWNPLMFRIRIPRRYILSGREIRIQLKSNNADGDAKLDYEGIHITYLSIPATPSPVQSKVPQKRPGILSVPAVTPQP